MSHTAATPGQTFYTSSGGDWDEIADAVREAGEEHIGVNMGPQHPSTHGVLRLILELDGDQDVSGRAFALDPEGRPRFVMHTTKAYLGVGQRTPATWWVSCDAGCDSPDGWTKTKISDQMWRGATLRSGDLGDSVARLTQRHDAVHVIGSLDLVQSLLRLRLVDRLELWLHPLLLGSGKQVFADGTVPTALRLLESVTHPSGIVQLVYEPAGEPTYGDLAA